MVVFMTIGSCDDCRWTILSRKKDTPTANLDDEVASRHEEKSEASKSYNKFIIAGAMVFLCTYVGTEGVCLSVCPSASVCIVSVSVCLWVFVCVSGCLYVSVCVCVFVLYIERQRTHRSVAV